MSAPAARHPRATRRPSLRSLPPAVVLALFAGLVLGLVPVTAAGAVSETGPEVRQQQSGLLSPLFPQQSQQPQAAASVDEGRLAKDHPRLPKRCGLLVDGQVPAKPRRCVIKKVGRQHPVLVLWGDSHMWQMVPAVKKALRGQKVGLVAFLYGNCAPAIPDMQRFRGNVCMQTQVKAREYVATAKRQGRDVRVVLGAFWGAHLNRLAHYDSPESRRGFAAKRKLLMSYGRPLFTWLGRNRIPTDIQVQGPSAVPPNPSCRPGPPPFQCDIPRRDAMFREKEVLTFLRQMMRRLPKGAKLINSTNGVCRPAVCPAVQPGGQHTWFDPYHLSLSMTSTLDRFYRPTVRALTR